MSFLDWTPDDEPFVVVDTTTDAGWNDLRSAFTPNAVSPPFERIIEIAKAHGVISVLVERRYIDLDYRSEHARFYAGAFRRYPSVTHRLHFFADALDDSLKDLPDRTDAYCGYSVMRPLPRPVGRTMIKPPPELAEATATRCEGEETVHIFGWPFRIQAMPFMSQEAQYMRCAHATQWMVLHHAHLAHALPRRVAADIHDASIGGVVVDRQVPSGGLSLPQMLQSLGTLGLSPAAVGLPQSRPESEGNLLLSLFAVLCRYINSQLPPIVVSNHHAWVVVAYIRDPQKHGHDSITLYRHDDETGPYIRVDDPWQEPQPVYKWITAIPPLPPKVFITAEKAEVLGQYWLLSAANQVGKQDTLDLAAANNLSFRTYARFNYAFKASAQGRVSEDVEQLYRFAQWPRYVWVVEAIDRTRRKDGNPAVMGEVVLDPTAHQHTSGADPVHQAVLAIHVEGWAVSLAPDHETASVTDSPAFTPYLSGCGDFE